MKIEVGSKVYSFGSSAGDVYVIEGVVQSITGDRVKLTHVKELRRMSDDKINEKSVGDTEISKKFLEMPLDQQKCEWDETFKVIVHQLKDRSK